MEKELFCRVTLRFLREKQCTKQIDAILPCIYTVITHSGHQNVIRTVICAGLLAMLVTHFKERWNTEAISVPTLINFFFLLGINFLHVFKILNTPVKPNCFTVGVNFTEASKYIEYFLCIFTAAV